MLCKKSEQQRASTQGHPLMLESRIARAMQRYTCHHGINRLSGYNSQAIILNLAPLALDDYRPVSGGGSAASSVRDMARLSIGKWDIDHVVGTPVEATSAGCAFPFLGVPPQPWRPRTRPLRHGPPPAATPLAVADSHQAGRRLGGAVPRGGLLSDLAARRFVRQDLSYTHTPRSHTRRTRNPLRTSVLSKAGAATEWRCGSNGLGFS